jgi:DnaJ-class molecular chaperone
MPPTNEPAAIDFYERLGIGQDASSAEITAAYRRLARSLHPDSAPSDPDPRALQDVIAAHRVLSDPKRRRDYDQRGNRPMLDAAGPLSANACRVCNGTGRIRIVCPRCAGAGFTLIDTPWLQTPVRCPACAGGKYRQTACGACAGSRGR